MALPAALQALFDRLQTYNSDAYNASTNPGGFARGGNQKPVDNFIKSVRDFTAFGKGISDLTSQAEADAQATAADRVQTGKDVTTTGQARDKAQAWANAPEDQEVEAGKFSAFHFLRKTIAQFNLAKAQADAAAAAYDAFDDRYLGAKSADPTVDNDGNALIVGALYFSTSDNVMKVWNGLGWQVQVPAAADYLARAGGTMTGLITFFASQFATQAQAEAGTDTSKLMTPQRVAQAIAKLVAPSKFESALFYARQEAAPGATGQNSVTQVWTTRILNTLLVNEFGAGLSGSTIQLAAGTYIAQARAPATRVAHQIRLQNTTDGSTLILGSSAYSTTSEEASNDSTLFGKFSINGSKSVQLQHWSDNNNYSMGRSSSIAGSSSVFAEIMIWKVG